MPGETGLHEAAADLERLTVRAQLCGFRPKFIWRSVAFWVDAAISHPSLRHVLVQVERRLSCAHDRQRSRKPFGPNQAGWLRSSSLLSRPALFQRGDDRLAACSREFAFRFGRLDYRLCRTGRFASDLCPPELLSFAHPVSGCGAPLPPYSFCWCRSVEVFWYAGQHRP